MNHNNRRPHAQFYLQVQAPQETQRFTDRLAAFVEKFAHSHSANQFRRHLPLHWNSIMLPPHCGQIRLMIEEMMLELDSPGIVSIVFITASIRSVKMLCDFCGMQAACQLWM